MFRPNAERDVLFNLDKLAVRKFEHRFARADLHSSTVADQFTLGQIHFGRADKCCHESVDRPVVEIERATDLLDQAVPHDDDPITERHGFDLVVRHEDHRGAKPRMQRRDLLASLHAQLCVKVGKRLVQQKNVGVANERATERDALHLTARQLSRLPLEQRLQTKTRRRASHTTIDLVLRLAPDTQAERHVVVDGLLRIKRVAGQGGYQSAALAALFSPQSAFFSLAAGLTQPIFDAGRIQANFDLTKAQQDELLQTYRKTVISAFADVDNALVAVRQTSERLRLQRVVVTASRRAFDLSERQLQAGTADIVTVLNTQLTLFQAEDSLTQAELARLQAIVSLYQALGGGWMPKVEARSNAL